MRQVAWMAAAATLLWLAIEATMGAGVNPEVLYGMSGPLVVACLSWVATERTYTASPERLTGILLKGLAIKAIFFGVYVTVMLRLLEMRPVPFMLSFTAYFIVLHVMEALFMRRLFMRAEAH